MMGHILQRSVYKFGYLADGVRPLQQRLDDLEAIAFTQRLHVAGATLCLQFIFHLMWAANSECTRTALATRRVTKFFTCSRNNLDSCGATTV